MCSGAKCNDIVVHKAGLIPPLFESDRGNDQFVAREAGALNNGTYRELTKVDPLPASQSLRRLRDAGLLAQRGRGSATYCLPTDSTACAHWCVKTA